jgi:transcriptional regulator with XRE-family HTH domain
MRKLELRRPSIKDLAKITGSRIQAFRRERKWTRSFLASRVEVRPEQLADYERGGSLPSTYTLYQLAEVFGVSPGALFGDQPRKRPAGSRRLSHLARRLETLSTEDQQTVTLFLETFLGTLERDRRRR